MACAAIQADTTLKATLYNVGVNSTRCLIFEISKLLVHEPCIYTCTYGLLIGSPEGTHGLCSYLADTTLKATLDNVGVNFTR